MNYDEHRKSKHRSHRANDGGPPRAGGAGGCTQHGESFLTRNGSGCILLMAYLNDAALWQAGRATMTTEQRERLEALHDKHQREGLTPDEQAPEHEGHGSTRNTRKEVLSASRLSRLSRPFAAFVVQTDGQIRPRCEHAAPRCAEEPTPTPRGIQDKKGNEDEHSTSRGDSSCD